MKCGAVKLLEVNTGENLYDLGFGSEFVDAMKHNLKEKIDNLDFIKLKPALQKTLLRG